MYSYQKLKKSSRKEYNKYYLYREKIRKAFIMKKMVTPNTLQLPNLPFVAQSV